MRLFHACVCAGRGSVSFVPPCVSMRSLAWHKDTVKSDYIEHWLNQTKSPKPVFLFQVAVPVVECRRCEEEDVVAVDDPGEDLGHGILAGMAALEKAGRSNGKKKMGQMKGCLGEN